MRLAILNLSARYPPLAHHGSAADNIEQWLAPHLPEAHISQLQIVDGAALPALAAFDGYVLSGSEKGVYDSCPWMQPLQHFIRRLRDTGKPLFGICFGHQIIDEACGGKAQQAGTGLVVGVRRYSGADGDYLAYAMHRDQVVQVPDSATVTATSDYCAVAALEYDFAARSVQFHPEFQHQLVADAIEVFDGELLNTAQAEAARLSIASHRVERALYARQTADFFRQWV